MHDVGRRAYIDPARKVFAHLDRLAAWQRGEKPAPVTIEWDLSNVCDLGCDNCHFSYTHTKGPWTRMSRSFPLERDTTATHFADPVLVRRVLADVKSAGVRSIVWSGGGEPTLHPSWPAIIDAAHRLGLEQGMYTHGGLLTPERAQHLAERASWVVVSLDYSDAATYARYKHVPPKRFEAACNGIVSLVGHQAVVGVSFLLHAQNWMHARDYVRLGRELGATYTTLRPLVQTQPDQPGVITGDRSWITNALPLLEELALDPDVEVDPARFAAYRDWTSHPYQTCHGIKLNTTITTDGRVWLCPNRREFSGSCLGDLRVESFADIWARHPGQWNEFDQCRAMCRLNQVNRTLAEVYRPRLHEAFV